MAFCTQGKATQNRRGCKHDDECRPRQQVEPLEAERDCDRQQQTADQQLPEVSRGLVLRLEEIKRVWTHLSSVRPPGVRKS